MNDFVGGSGEILFFLSAPCLYFSQSKIRIPCCVEFLMQVVQQTSSALS